MEQKITEGVSIQVVTFYLDDQSHVLNNEYFFAYRITMQNLTKFPVKLLSRYWDIFDSNGTQRVVEGDGVVGQQPILEPGQEYKYTSACNLRTDMGKMGGYYVFENLFDKRKFKVAIPEFQLIVPAKFN
jgi:ApaG protein